MSHYHKIISNTLGLYAGMGITTVLYFFSARYVLTALGIVDYGIYATIASIMGFFGFINIAMTISSQRHLAHAVGGGDAGKLKKTFGACLGLHLGILVLLLLLGETVGLYFLNQVLNIPVGRMESARLVYQCSLFSFSAFIVSVPYRSLMMAREALLITAAFGVLQAILSFGQAMCVLKYGGDRLNLYALLGLFISLGITILYVIMCNARYPEARPSILHLWNRSLTLDILGFSGWNLLGTVASVSRAQGIAVVLNVIFGPSINAAYGIASQVGGQLSQYTQAVLLAVTPRMMQIEGSGDRNRLQAMSLSSSKIAFFLACLAIIPLISEMPVLLDVWLKIVPDHCVIFCQLSLAMLVVEQLTSGSYISLISVGKIGWFQIATSILVVSVIPVGYFLLKDGFPPASILVVALSMTILAGIVRLWYAKRTAGMPYSPWFKEVLVRCVIGIVPGIFCAIISHIILPYGAVQTIITICSSLIGTVLGVLLLGMNQQERYKITSLLKAAVERGMLLKRYFVAE